MGSDVPAAHLGLDHKPCTMSQLCVGVEASIQRALLSFLSGDWCTSTVLSCALLPPIIELGPLFSFFCDPGWPLQCVRWNLLQLPVRKVPLISTVGHLSSSGPF